MVALIWIGRFWERSVSGEGLWLSIKLSARNACAYSGLRFTPSLGFTDADHKSTDQSQNPILPLVRLIHAKWLCPSLACGPESINNRD